MLRRKIEFTLYIVLILVYEINGFLLGNAKPYKKISRAVMRWRDIENKSFPMV